MPRGKAKTGPSTRSKGNQTTRNAKYTTAPTKPPAWELILSGDSELEENYMGVYELLTEEDDQPLYHDNRPVYRRRGRYPASAVYLYYWEKTGRWLVGPNIKQGDKYFMRVRDSSDLPEDIKATWKNRAKERLQLKIERPPTRKVTPGMFSSMDSGMNSGVSTEALDKDVKERLQRLLWDGRYSTAAGGKAVIINNIEFDLPGLEKRKGAEHDSKKMKRALENLGMRVEVHENKTTSEMESIMKLQAKADHTNNDYFVCVVMSHGELGRVCGSDGEKVKVLDLVTEISACPSLSGKPKVFIIQACQGKKEQTGRLEADASPPSPDIGVFISKEADVFIGLATFPGFVTMRDTITGALYINKLVEVLDREGQEQDLVTMMTKVNDEMNRESKSVPCHVSSLTKKLFFVMPENVPQ